MSGLFVDAVCSLSLSQALGKPKPFWFGFPLVFSSSWPRSLTSTRTPRSAPTPRPCPAPVFFLSSSSLVSGSVFSRFLSCRCRWSWWVCFFFLVLVLFKLLLCFCFLSWPSGAFFSLLGWWGSPCRVFPVVSPWFLSGLGVRFVFLLAAFLHLASPL